MTTEKTCMSCNQAIKEKSKKEDFCKECYEGIFEGSADPMGEFWGENK